MNRPAWTKARDFLGLEVTVSVTGIIVGYRQEVGDEGQIERDFDIGIKHTDGAETMPHSGMPVIYGIDPGQISSYRTQTNHDGPPPAYAIEGESEEES